MPNFYTYEVKTARAIVRNPNPVAINTQGSALLLEVATAIQAYSASTPTATIPGGGSATFDFIFDFSTRSPGTHNLILEFWEPATGLLLLRVQATEAVVLYVAGLDLVSITWA